MKVYSIGKLTSLGEGDTRELMRDHYSQIYPLCYIQDVTGGHEHAVGLHHCGENIERLCTIQRSDAFRKFARTIKTEIEKWWPVNPYHPYSIVIADDTGSHTAVSWARITGMMLDSDYKVSVEHLSLQTWSWKMCDDCQNCRLDGRGKDRLCQTLVEFYRSI